MPRFRVSELALDHVERHAFASHLDGVGRGRSWCGAMQCCTQPPRRGSALSCGLRRRLRSSRGSAVDDAQQRADRRRTRYSSHGAI